MEGRQLCQWDKDSCADAGFLKIDLLGLGMLSAVERCVDEIARVRGVGWTSRGSRTTTSRPMTRSSWRTRWACSRSSRARRWRRCGGRGRRSLEDLTIQVAIVRPGPILGGAVNPYIARLQRLREDPDYVVPYEHPIARGGPARHARDDHLPGPGDRGRAGVRGVLAGQGGGAAAGDEPQALGGGDRGVPRGVPRRRGGDARRRSRDRRARLRR